MSYRTTQYVMLRYSVWHCLEMSYRFPQSIWLNQIIPCHTFTSSSPLLTHKHCSCSRFSSFCNKTCWFRLSSVKHLLVTYFLPKLSRIAAGFSLSFKPRFRRVGLSRTSCTYFERFWSICDRVCEYLTLVYTFWSSCGGLSVLISKPCFLLSKIRVLWSQLGTFEVSGC